MRLVVWVLVAVVVGAWGSLVGLLWGISLGVFPLALWTYQATVGLVLVGLVSVVLLGGVMVYEWMRPDEPILVQAGEGITWVGVGQFLGVVVITVAAVLVLGIPWGLFVLVIPVFLLPRYRSSRDPVHRVLVAHQNDTLISWATLADETLMTRWEVETLLRRMLDDGVVSGHVDGEGYHPLAP